MQGDEFAVPKYTTNKFVENFFFVYNICRKLLNSSYKSWTFSETTTSQIFPEAELQGADFDFNKPN